MYHRHELHPDLIDSLLENRALLASFLASTYYEPPAFSGTEPAFNPPGPTFQETSFNTSEEGDDFLEPTNTASYSGFGSNPFGLGLSPLSGVVSAYSENSALSNMIGAGSSMPAAALTLVGVSSQSSLATPQPNGPNIEGVTTTPAPGANLGYGANFSSGFSFGVNSGNSFGMGSSPVGSMSASRVGYTPTPPITGATEDANAESGPASGAPNGKALNPGERAPTAEPASGARPQASEPVPGASQNPDLDAPKQPAPSNRAPVEHPQSQEHPKTSPPKSWEHPNDSADLPRDQETLPTDFSFETADFPDTVVMEPGALRLFDLVRRLMEGQF